MSHTYIGPFREPYPPWRPAAGDAVSIGYSQGAHPVSGRAATLYDARPSIQTWNPGTEPWKTSNNYGFNTHPAYCGGVWVPSMRKWVVLGAGHAAYCIPALVAYDMAGLWWEWLETPVPTDGLSLVASLGNANPTIDRNAVDAAYTNSEFDTTDWWWRGSSSTWGNFRQPGKFFVEPAHTYYGLVWVPGPSVGNVNGIILKCCTSSGRHAECLVPTRHYFDLDTRLWGLTTNFRSNPSAAAGGSIYMGGSIDRVFSITNTSGGFFPSNVDVFNPATKTWSTTSILSSSLILWIFSGGLIAHEPTSLLIHCAPATSQAGSGAQTYVNATQHQFWAADAAAIKAGTAVTFAQLTVSNPGGTWPVRPTYNPGGAAGQMTWMPHPNGSFYAHNGNHLSTKLWKLSPPAGATTAAAGLAGTWTLTEETLARGIPSGGTGGQVGDAIASGGTGTLDVFNRMPYDALSGCFIWFDQWYQSRPVAIRPAGT